MNFQAELEKLGISLNQQQENQFESYYQKLIEVNRVMNLTAITEKEEVYRKHFLDSLELMRVCKKDVQYTICDVGGGAGFPSIPLAIVQESAKITVIDAQNKRIEFLKTVIEELKLQNVSAIHIRAEEYVKEKREYFDIVTARAVARLNVLAELCLPLTRVGGFFLAMKGSSGQQELEEASKAIQILGGKTHETLAFTLPDENEERQIIIIEKVRETPAKYPRNFNKIKEKPL